VKHTRGLVERNFHLGKAAGCSRVNGGGDLIEMQFHERPLLIAEDDNRNFSVRKVLLILDILVGAEKDFIPRCFSLFDQRAVSQLVPANLPRECDFVARKTTRNRLRGAVVE
jgi:hypothetical protein